MSLPNRLARASAAVLFVVVLVSTVGSLWVPDPLPGGLWGRGLVPGVKTGVIAAWWIVSTKNAVLVVGGATLVASVLGLGLGAVSVYLAGGTGVVLSRLLQFSGAVPSLLLVGMFRFWDPTGGVASLVGTLALLRTLEVAQLVRTQVLTTMPSDFVEASRALGASRRWQFRVHVLPHLAGPLGANLVFGASSLIGLEAALSFTGLGLPADVPSWGGALGSLCRGGSPSAFACAVVSLAITSAALYGLGTGIAGQARRQSP